MEVEVLEVVVQAVVGQSWAQFRVTKVQKKSCEVKDESTANHYT